METLLNCQKRKKNAAKFQQENKEAYFQQKKEQEARTRDVTSTR